MIDWFIKWLQIGLLEQDSVELKLQKQFLVFLTAFMSFGGLVWGGISLRYALYAQSLIPYGYAVISTLNMSYFFRSKNFTPVKNLQTSISLLLPFFFQWSLGGFAPSGAILIWSVIALLGSIAFHRTISSFVWLTLFLLLTVFSAYFDSFFFLFKPSILSDFSLLFFAMNLTTVPAILFGLMFFFVKRQEKTQQELEVKQGEILVQNQLLQQSEEKLSHKNKELESINETLNRYGEYLEKRVEERTRVLQENEEELRQNLEELQVTQEHLKQNLTLVEKQRDEILSSINYARRIQTALLPKKSRLLKKLPNFLLFYLPKDIVSGDFYWFSNLVGSGNETVANYPPSPLATAQPCMILIAADCTGHGVSGAFMTVIGNSLLDRIINRDHICSPAQILQELDTRLIQTLKQQVSEGERINDGMDISVLKINKETQKLTFAGAKRPLWIFEQGNPAPAEYKGDKFPIGGEHFNNKVFTEREIPLQKGQVVYLFTDGYPDQFSQEGKFLLRRFRELLSQIFEKEFQEQEIILQETLNNWKKDQKQTDDILVMGLRF